MSEWSDMSTLGLLFQHVIEALSKANYKFWSNTKRKLLMSHQIVTFWRHDRSYQFLK